MGESSSESWLRAAIAALFDELPADHRDLAEAIRRAEPGTGMLWPQADGTVTVTIGSESPMVLGTITVPDYDES